MKPFNPLRFGYHGRMRPARWRLWTVSFLLIGSTLLAGRDLLLLNRQLDLLWEDPFFARAFLGVKIQSLAGGEILYQRNAGKLLMPASNMKLVTAAAAAERLGLDFRYTTVIAARGKVSGDTLNGDLVVIGSGDPTLGARPSSPDLEDIDQGDPLQIFRQWADQLKSRGVRRVRGDLVGDGSVFDGVKAGRGWSWDDLPFAYAAEVSGLQFNENSALVRLSPGERLGAPTGLEVIPATTYLKIENDVLTGGETAETELRFEQLSPGRLRISGVLAPTLPAEQRIAVPDPPRYFLTVLREVLESQGIRIEGEIRQEVLAEQSRSSLVELVRHQSPDLRFILKVLLKISQNLYAETLLKTVDPPARGKSFAGGLRQSEAVLVSMGIPPDAFVLADGSGLSRHNLLSPEALTRLLRFVHRRPYREDFVAALPVAGLDGTLRERMKGTPAEGRVQAKTGTLGQVRCLSGYLTTQEGELLCFSMMANHFDQPVRSADYLIDSALGYLAGISGAALRRPPLSTLRGE